MRDLAEALGEGYEGDLLEAVERETVPRSGTRYIFKKWKTRTPKRSTLTKYFRKMKKTFDIGKDNRYNSYAMPKLRKKAPGRESAGR
mmetsp:Transcript_27988/g.78309  ORF Transcript_27988/g.78309 Transcript_27988/m.78309 type:complete len:87 (-) Transcript_27988:9-269(-)